MERFLHIHKLLLRSRRMPLVVVALTLLVLAGVIVLTTLQVRQRIREQIAGRDGEVLHAVALMQYAEDVEAGLAGPISDPGNQLSVVLKSSQLKGVLGVRLFDAAGNFVETFPPNVREADLDLRWLEPLAALKPVSQFRPQVRIATLFYPESTNARPVQGQLPLLEVNVPLHPLDGGELAGIAQFLLEGHSIAAEFARLDRHLAIQATVALGVAGSLLVVVIGWAFRRLRRAHRLLAERTEDLVKANQELALAAKTSALGTVAAHLIHGLKNPLAGLQTFVSTRGQGPDPDQTEDWQQALASTRRMQSMIHRVIGVMHEEESGVHYEVTLAELCESVSRPLSASTREAGVNFSARIDAEAALPNHAASLVALILENLVQNALQATAAGKSVALAVSRRDGQIVFQVRDEGPGFPSGLKPFAPCRSAKEGGSGLGLALSKQLANHLGAALELKANSSAGCVFELMLPRNLEVSKLNMAHLSGVV